MFEHAVDQQLLLLIQFFSEQAGFCDQFYLAGGTALALQLGHRKSDDLDWFIRGDMNSDEIVSWIAKRNGKIIKHEKRTVLGDIGDINVSFFHYPEKLIRPLVPFRNIFLCGTEDILCMKLMAVSQCAEKKDYFDLFTQSQNIPFSVMPGLLSEKYGNHRINLYHVARSLLYFDEADDSPEPMSLLGVTWDDVKKYFYNNEKNIHQTFLN